MLCEEGGGVRFIGDGGVMVPPISIPLVNCCSFVKLLALQALPAADCEFCNLPEHPPDDGEVEHAGVVECMCECIGDWINVEQGDEPSRCCICGGSDDVIRCCITVVTGTLGG